jgi:hypothetical protein
MKYGFAIIPDIPQEYFISPQGDTSYLRRRYFLLPQGNTSF